MEKVNNELDSLINYIKNTYDYKMCIKLKKQMNENDELMKLINDIRFLQKKYIKSSYDDNVKEELNKKNQELFNIPLYVVYNQYLSNVNEMIEYVKNSLNNYFYDLLNTNK